MFLSLLITTLACGQSTRELLKSGNKYFHNKDYRSAIPFYEQVLARNPNHAKTLYRVGIAYVDFDKEKAGNYIALAKRLKPRIARDFEYWQGRLDLMNYKFDDAIGHFLLFDDRLRKNDIRKEEVAMLIAQSRFAKTQYHNPKDLFVRNLGAVVNSRYSDHSPVVGPDGSSLLYSSRSSQNAGGQEDPASAFADDIVNSRQNGPDDFDRPEPFPHLSSQYQDAVLQLYDNGSKALLHRNENNGDLFVSTRQQDGSWSKAEPLGGAVNSRDQEGGAFISPDGKQLYFVTNHYSEKRDKDIYVSLKDKDGNWGKPRNLGGIINSAADEESPFLASDGKTLYFSSRGHKNMGGFDVFVSRFDSVSNKWSQPENLGYPINSPGDDLHYRLSPDGDHAYLSSYRMGGYGDKDIYAVSFIRPVQVRGYVYNSHDSTALSGVEVVFSGQQLDKKAISYRDVTKPGTGAFSVELLSGRTYQVALNKDGQNLSTTALDIPVVTSGAMVINQGFYVPYEDLMLSQQFAFNRIHFDLDEYMLRPEAIEELDRMLVVLKENPQINLSIDGHCDSRHTDAYNMVLGEKRAKATFDYLVKNGISERRLVTISYGERRPLAPNDSPENMELNRRVEFSIIPRAGESAVSLGAPARELNLGALAEE